ncbi:MAG: 16S rRNA (guanine(966)-N(2))-methyltransferase RsmD [Gammaproteobacteria bacterium]|nr:16S rRNA (guanine(966)-N(2))-methyltransferase RsmD [Gammaproteobacteria bacterium]MDH4315754.1 16S rRNA (guanine(966)-N(2))-methyltransferase RsmD [Gammaproteobacteria bacterium]MDH5214998.1 16S rRNA (guanine(966)-N(2))-methyltransferase RsmD [Gammaproteobacteria bacterium]
MPAQRSRTEKKLQPGRLRIVAGKWRSRLVPIADVPGLRPTPERIRETLFNWLAPGIEGARCLDLCAGTGALGLEALSRGAASVVFVEQSKAAADSLQKSIRTLDASGAELQRCAAQSYLARSDLPSFDIVFLDPPFADNLHGELCRLLVASACLAKNAKVYVEQDRAADPLAMPPGWTTTHEKTAGNVRYSLVSVGQVLQGGER